MQPIQTRSNEIPAVQTGQLRRRLQAELSEMESLIQGSRLHDEMTRTIALWRDRFVHALQISPDEQRVFEAYIPLLQEMLVDPVTRAPFDLFAVLGSDGHTYGHLSLAVHQLTVPELLRHRSPLDMNNEEPFHIQPHPVVRHMTRWLQQHNALLYSEEVDRALLALVPREEKTSADEQADKIRARLQRMEERALQRQVQRRRKVQQRIQEKLEHWNQEVDQRFAPLMAQLREPVHAELHPHVLEGVVRQQGEALQHIRDNLAHIEQDQQRLIDDQNALFENEEAYLAQLNRQIDQMVQEQFQPIIDRIQAFTQDVFQRIEHMSEEDTALYQRAQGRIREIREQAREAERRNQELEEEIHTTGQAVDEAKKTEESLQQQINETRDAIREMEDKSSTEVLGAILCVGGAIFGTWALKAAFSGTTFGSHAATRLFTTPQGGKGLSFTVRF